MSFLGASGAAAGSGRTKPSVPTFDFTLNIKNNNESPEFRISNVNFTTGTKTAGTGTILITVYKTSDNSEVTSYAPATPPYNFSLGLVKGTQYYVKVRSNDSLGVVSDYSAKSADRYAIVKPADVSSVTGSLPATSIIYNWTAVDAGGSPTPVNYNLVFQRSTDSGSTWTDISTLNITGTSQAYDTTSLSSGLYRLRVTPSTGGGTAATTTSNSVSYSPAPPPPPPPPPPPWFPPWFPPSFGPSFGPYFCLQADSPVLVWVDGKTLKKKVKDIQVGDKVVSYTFAELPENDSEYSLDSWNSQSMTPLEVKEATVVTNEKLVTQSTLFFNGDQDNRMSLEHLVFIKRNGVYSIVLAGLVEVGDTILKIDEESLTIYEDVISSIEHINEQTEIYKLDVTPYDIFFGGNMLTHNKGFVY
jgi:hypothetical protein